MPQYPHANVNLDKLKLKITRCTPTSPLFPYTTLFRSLIVGVNGTGKTTTVGKLANLLKTQGQRPLICRSEEHTSELQSRFDLVCRLLLEKKKKHKLKSSV